MDKKSGIYLELVFLDGFFNVAQGLSVLVLFGFDVDYLTLPIRRLYRKWRYGEDSLNLPPWEDLSDESKTHCQQFLKHHIENCMATILTDVKYRLITHR